MPGCRRCRPAGHVGRGSVADRPLEHRKREPVDLQEHDPGGPRCGRVPSTPRHPPRHTQRVGVIVVDPGGYTDPSADRRGDERHRQGRAKAVHVELCRQDLGREQQHPRVQPEDKQEADADGEGQPQRGHERRQDRVQYRDDRCHRHRAGETPDLGSGEQLGGQQQG
jgi:hypothetical protein